MTCKGRGGFLHKLGPYGHYHGVDDRSSTGEAKRVRMGLRTSEAGLWVQDSER